MSYLKEQVATATNTKELTWLLGLSGVATFLPFVLHLQLLTGPIINAILIITLIVVGIRSALVVALIPSIMALAGGLLPLVLAPTVPFIMLSNVLMLLCIDWACNSVIPGEQGEGRESSFSQIAAISYWKGLILGSAVKSLFLFVLASFVIKLIGNPAATQMVPKLFGALQLATALVGGLIAFGFLKFIKKI